jgi:hypothetical protein
MLQFRGGSSSPECITQSPFDETAVKLVLGLQDGGYLAFEDTLEPRITRKSSHAA